MLSIVLFSSQDLVEDFVFPASKLIVEARNGSGKKRAVDTNQLTIYLTILERKLRNLERLALLHFRFVCRR